MGSVWRMRLCVVVCMLFAVGPCVEAGWSGRKTGFGGATTIGLQLRKATTAACLAFGIGLGPVRNLSSTSLYQVVFEQLQLRIYSVANNKGALEKAPMSQSMLHSVQLLLEFLKILFVDVDLLACS